MKEVFEKIIEKLETECDYINQYGELFISLEQAQGIVNQAAAEYEECIQNCTECGSHDKEKHNCPKFCKVIAETVKEIEENHNGWIPCSERLPKCGEVVMCCCANGGITVSCITHKYVKLSKIVWFGQHRVIAWQPLPTDEGCTGYEQKRTNFDKCCESTEAMAQIIDMAKIGWTKDQIMEWLQSEVEG